MKRGVLMICLFLCGCAKRPVKTRIPNNCYKVQITDFTQPCDSLKNGDLMCDRVRVHVNCVSVK